MPFHAVFSKNVSESPQALLLKSKNIRWWLLLYRLMFLKILYFFLFINVCDEAKFKKNHLKMLTMLIPMKIFWKEITFLVVTEVASKEWD